MEFCPNLMSVRDDPVVWARKREAEGWHAIGVADHLFTAEVTYPHLWVTLAQMAMVTKRVRLTSCFANNLFRSPVEFAQASLALQRASEGRFEAGLGAGWSRDEMVLTGRAYPDAPTRAAMYREAIIIARSLLRDGACDFAGAHYRVSVSAIGPRCSPPPPLVASCGGPRTIREVSPLVDRVEVKAAGPATRGGSLDFVKLASVTLDDLRRNVDRVRAASPTVAISVFGLCAAGNAPEVVALEESLGDGLYGRFVGHPEKVANNMLRLGDLGVSRVQVSALVPGTEEALAPYLAKEHR